MKTAPQDVPLPGKGAFDPPRIAALAAPDGAASGARCGGPTRSGTKKQGAISDPCRAPAAAFSGGFIHNANKLHVRILLSAWPASLQA